jgi:cytochrome c553
MKNSMKNGMKKWMQFLVLISSITSTSALLASGGIEGGGGNNMSPVTNVKWKAECSSCHMLYHPGLLPERSWNKLMSGLDKHFGENASLDAATRDEITNFLVTNSAEKSTNRRSNRINQSIPASATPLRISKTRYFTSKHDEVSPSTFKRKSIGSAANCVACHQSAEKGDFSESQVKIPR